MTTQQELTRCAKRLSEVLIEKKVRVVFAESCTGGLVSNALTRISGISEWHCGSAVVYRVETKAEWLGIDRDILEKPGPVSRVVATLMAENVLDKTPEADVAASITGHLGPNAPAKQDGLIFVGISHRSSEDRPSKTTVKRHVLEPASETLSGVKLRNRRQISAAIFVIESV
ncbi:MAG: CinA family protein, partial [Planctomycetaceae bacterium]|nr:CinA family protein [Planctomycetaceae bacterium]